MKFNSITFLIFLAVTLSLYYRLGRKGQNWLLLIASYVFYGWWDYRYTALLFATSMLDYMFAGWIDSNPSQRQRKLFLALSIFLNMSVLCIFKYFDFFAGSFAILLAKLGINASFPILHLLLPLGISFYTFLSMSYTIDVYRREIPVAKSPIDFLLYVSFFPHLVAGPIVRASYLLPQCQSVRVISKDQVINGFWLILLGYVKKVVVADQLGQIVDWGFSRPSPPFADANAWLIIYSFAFQVYGDFSGYSDIARGLAKLMGFELIVNFRAPYLVTNPSAFWRHWHISLSTWLRDYLYIPLGGNRHGTVRTYCNLMITMLLGGLWHGAGAAYVLWGLFHGLLLALHRWWNENFALTRRSVPTAPASMSFMARPFLPHRLLFIFLFFHLTCVGWLLFRAGFISQITCSGCGQVSLVHSYLVAMFSFSLHGISPICQGVLVLGTVVFLLQWKHEAMDRFVQWSTGWKIAAVCGAFATIAGLGIFDGAQFIYFQF